MKYVLWQLLTVSFFVISLKIKSNLELWKSSYSMSLFTKLTLYLFVVISLNEISESNLFSVYLQTEGWFTLDPLWTNKLCIKMMMIDWLLCHNEHTSLKMLIVLQVGKLCNEWIIYHWLFGDIIVITFNCNHWMNSFVSHGELCYLISSKSGHLCPFSWWRYLWIYDTIKKIVVVPLIKASSWNCICCLVCYFRKSIIRLSFYSNKCFPIN